ncbi:hypothetical protein [Thermocatellispora tengchongensis]|uniref:hypothetical protein n=1 Tax=Thermocatellispora tengchongensis TaxID=1073253 RepID=UPI00363C75F2
MRRTGGRRSPSWLPEPARPQSYALFWWWTAFLLPASTLVHSHVPALSEELYISCSWSGWEPADTSWSAAVAWISEILAVLFPGIPVVLVLCAWLVARRGSGRPRVHLWAAGTAVTLIAGSYTLSRVQSLLEPVPEYATCTVDPATLNEVSPARIALALTPAALVLVAAWTGLRPPPLPPRRPVPWRPILVAAALFALPVAGAVALMRLTPYEPAEPVLAADGTPRYALALGDRLTVVDLAEGGEPVTVAAPDPEFYQYTAIAPDREPGRYVASVTTAGDGAFGGRRSRIHRVDLDGDGGAVVLGQVGPEVEGMISDVAVSPSGEIAYARLVAEPGDSFEVGTTHVGLVNARREWSAPRGQGLGAFGDGALGLHWRDAGTLVFRAVPPRRARPAWWPWTCAVRAPTCSPRRRRCTPCPS